MGGHIFDHIQGHIKGVFRPGVVPTGTVITPTPSFDPASLFVGGYAGGAWAMTAANLKQSNAGTGSVVNGDAVGYVTDLSGNGNHLVQATSSKRPTYVESGGVCYLDFDGVDDAMESSALGITSTALTLVAAWAPITVASGSVPFEARGFNVNAAGTISVYSGITGSGQINWLTESGNRTVSGVSGTTRIVSEFIVDRTQATVASEVTTRTNGASAGVDSGSPVTGSFSSWILDVGARTGTSFYSGMELSALLIIGRLLTTEELAQVRTWAGAYAGVTI